MSHTADKSIFHVGGVFFVFFSVSTAVNSPSSSAKFGAPRNVLWTERGESLASFLTFDKCDISAGEPRHYLMFFRHFSSFCPEMSTYRKLSFPVGCKRV